MSSKLSTTSKIQLDQFKIPLKSNSFTSSSSLVRDNFSYSDACRSYSSCDSITSSGSDWKPVSSISTNKRKDSSSIELDSSSKKKKTTKIKKDTQKISKKISKKTNSKVKHADSFIDENSEKFQELSDALNSIENKALTKLILNTLSTFSKSNEMLKTMNEQLVSNNNTLAEALVVSNQLIRNSTNVKESSQASIEAHSTATPKTNSTSPLTSNPISVCNSKPKISSKASMEASSTPTSKTISTCQLTTKPIDVQYDISRSRDVYKTRDSYEPDDAGSIGPQFIPPDHNNQKNNAKFYKLIDLSDFEKMAHDPKFIFNPTMPDTEKRKPTSTKASTRLVYAPDENNHRRRERLKFVIGYRHIILRGKRYHNWFRTDSNIVDVAMFLIKHAKACFGKKQIETYITQYCPPFQFYLRKYGFDRCYLLSYIKREIKVTVKKFMFHNIGISIHQGLRLIVMLGDHFHLIPLH